MTSILGFKKHVAANYQVFLQSTTRKLPSFSPKHHQETTKFLPKAPPGNYQVFTPKHPQQTTKFLPLANYQVLHKAPLAKYRVFYPKLEKKYLTKIYVKPDKILWVGGL